MCELGEKIQRIMTDNIRMAVIVDNHIHLGDAGWLFINFQAEQIILGELMPIPVMLEDVLLLLVICLAAHVIKRIQQKPPGAAGGIQHDMRAFRVKHFHRESDQFARRKVLTEIAFKKPPMNSSKATPLVSSSVQSREMPSRCSTHWARTGGSVLICSVNTPGSRACSA